jgi:hypothetical protein
VVNRAERREEIKLILEYVKISVSLGLLGAILFAGLEWQRANRASLQSNFLAVASAWRSHLTTFLDRPSLRPYFEAGKQLNDDDPNRESVLAIADVRLEVMDDILDYASLAGVGDQIGDWKRTFASAFRSSPILCQRLAETRTTYGLIVSIGDSECHPRR